MSNETGRYKPHAEKVMSAFRDGIDLLELPEKPKNLEMMKNSPNFAIVSVPAGQWQRIEQETSLPTKEDRPHVIGVTDKGRNFIVEATNASGGTGVMNTRFDVVPGYVFNPDDREWIVVPRYITVPEDLLDTYEKALKLNP